MATLPSSTASALVAPSRPAGAVGGSDDPGQVHRVEQLGLGGERLRWGDASLDDPPAVVKVRREEPELSGEQAGDFAERRLVGG